jgi:hypothetical protein
MRKQLITVPLILAVAALAAFGADNTLGTWKLDIAKSKYTPAPMPIKSLTSTREAMEGGAKVTTTGVQADGTPINSTVAVKYDGKDTTVTGAPWDTIAVKQVDANTLTAVTKQTNGKYNATGRTVISKDGKTMTTNTKGTAADGKPFTATLVYDKQ